MTPPPLSSYIVHSPSATHITINQLHRWPLIAQEKFPIFAEYSEAYAKYVKSINKNTADVLHFQKYGPWNIRQAGAAKRSAGIILAFANRANDGLGGPPPISLGICGRSDN
jgi:hypothetical protein